ncbi:MAG: phosphatidylserine/phosphatidylglycerophosphate/cardiolipin synthase family protein [Actinomycetota bacterium]|nr:phosphatidylserine/phosphatidylglycerophosphate/cardiolipin synthase family protein [Actinomycetota bacterium]
MDIDVRSLVDSGQDQVEIAEAIADYIGEAKRSLDIALYDLRLGAVTAPIVVAAIKAASARGVAGRVVYNIDHDKPIAVPPPPRTDDGLVDHLGLSSKAIPGIPDLMHHKYIVRDSTSVWTGSMNWTDDSFTREENVIIKVASPAIASMYSRDFEDLWSTGQVQGSGGFTSAPAQVDGHEVRAWFCPGRGRRLAHRVATAIGRASTRVSICSPVLTSGPILGAALDLASEGHVRVEGLIDLTQMQEVIGQWREKPQSSWKIEAFERLISAGSFKGKHSTPYAPGRVHDYMHAKMVVADDVVFIGSYNLSHSGEANAENVLEIKGRPIADRISQVIEEMRARYDEARFQ